MKRLSPVPARSGRRAFLFRRFLRVLCWMLPGLMPLSGVLGCSDDAARGIAPDPRENGVTVYTHTFPDGLAGIATGDFLRPSVSYPEIDLGPEYRHIFTFRMAPMSPPSLVPVPTHGPVVLYSDDMDVIVFSPMDHFFESLILVEDGAIRYGVEGEVECLPAGFSHSFVAVKGRGINATLERWGEILRAHYGRQRTDRYADTGASTLGYWTDNGGTYYYRTEPGLNEEETLLGVKAYADRAGIPYGYVQLDSWWYHKEPGGGLVLWEAKPEMFPAGLAAFRDRLGLPLVTHNRWFAPENDYRERTPFVDGEDARGMSFPLDPGPFREFMASAVSWGAVTYEQDWLDPQFWGVSWLRSGVGRAEQWMDWINDTASAAGLTVQLCMAGPAHFLSALRMPAVTTIRPSIDYHAFLPKVLYWPQFHEVAMLAWAVGVLPFKDNFQSGPTQTPVLFETCGPQEALISTLSAGMVGPSDRIGGSDAALLLCTCRADGMLLKPDRPAAPVDAMFLPHTRPYTTFTWSARPGTGRWTYLAAYHLAREGGLEGVFDEVANRISYGGVPLEAMFVFPEEITDWQVDLEKDLGIRGPVVAYDWRAGTAFRVSGTLELPRMSGRNDYAYLVLAPILENGLALLGETGKFVTLADRRFERVEAVPDGIRATLTGMPGEVVTLRAFDVTEDRMLEPVDATIGADGRGEAILVRSR
jgi:hypothetical protein